MFGMELAFRRIVRLEVWVLGLLLGGSCDPVYEYCVAVSDCTSGDPVSGVRVRFDHEGLRDTHTDSEGTACSANVGQPNAHTVHLVLEKDGYRPFAAAVESHGDELQAAVCMCRTTDDACVDGVSASRDAGLKPMRASPAEGLP